MATKEESKISFGVSTAGLDAGTSAMLVKQGEEAIKWQTIWAKAAARATEAQTSALKMWNAATAKAVEDNLALERLANDKSIAMARATAAEKVLAAKAAAIEMTEINAAGGISGGFGGGAVKGAESFAGKYAFDKAGKLIGKLGADGKLEKAAEDAAEGLEGMGKAAHGNSTVFREIFVLIREGLRGNFTRMIGSASILSGALGILGAVVAGLAITLPLTLLVGFKAYQTFEARKAAKQSEKDLHTKVDDTAEGLRGSIESLKKGGQLSPEQAQTYLEQLKHPDYDSVSRIQGEVNKLLPRGGKARLDADNEQRKEGADLDKQIAERQAAYAREAGSAQDKYNNSKLQELTIAGQLAGMDRSSNEYKRLYLDYIAAQKAAETDLADLKKEQAEKDKEAAEQKKQRDSEASSLYRRIGENQAELGQQEMVYPTIEELAGRRFTKRLGKAYAAGGRYDIGRGNGFMAGVARDYERDQYRLKYDLAYGNSEFDDKGNLTGGAAFGDRERLISERSQLINAGVAKPELQFARMVENTAAMAAKLDDLISHGAVINTRLAGTDT